MDTAPATCAGAVATIVSSLTTTHEVAFVPPNFTPVVATVPVNPVPETSTSVPPAAGPVIGVGNRYAYCASKAFLHSWLQSLRHQLRHNLIEVLELSPPYVQTKLTGEGQLADPRAMPLDAYVAEVMRMLEAGDHPRSELLLDRDNARRWAERDGTYEAVFAMLNPG